MMLGTIPSKEREEHDLRVQLEAEVDRLTKLVLAIEKAPSKARNMITAYRKEHLS